MKRLAWLITFALSSAQAIDFLPREVKERGEGGETTYLSFAEGAKAVTYMPPKHWSYRGRGDTFRLTAPDVPGAEIEIAVMEMDEPLVAGEESLKSFEALALKSLPEGASKIEEPVATFNPCELDGHKTVEITVAYVLFGQAVSVSRLYLPRAKDMLRFTVVTKPGDFERVRKTFQASLHSLAGI